MESVDRASGAGEDDGRGIDDVRSDGGGGASRLISRARGRMRGGSEVLGVVCGAMGMAK